MSDFADEDVSSCDDNWDTSDDDGEKKEEKKVPDKKKKGLKGLQAKIAEREAREKKEKEIRDMTPADRLAAEKQVQEDDELIGATEFVNIEDPESIDIGKFVPTTKYEFEKYAEAVSAKMKGLEVSPFYTDFVCNITRDFIKPLKVEDTRKVETVLKVQINELIKSSKKKGKSSKKGALNSGAGKGGVDRSNYDDYGDEDMDDLL